MYAKRYDEVARVEYYENIAEEAGCFFSKDTDRVLYVFKDGALFGIITQIDYKKNKENGNIINLNFKRLLQEKGKTENELCRDAEEIFITYKNIGEIPVVDENGTLQYVYKREGEASDVFPHRFFELYGGNDKLAKYISGLGRGEVTISADSPEMLKDYLRLWGVTSKYRISKELHDAMYDAERIFEEYELEIFCNRVKEKRSRFVFLTFPCVEKLTVLNEDELERFNLAKERTAQYYLQNYNYDEEIRKLAGRVLGSDANQEFVDAQKVIARFLIKGGLCYNTDNGSRYVNVINGRRVTTDVPETPDGEIYMFGPCTMFGMIVEDKYTIPSCLQRKLNALGFNREVINEGMVGVPLMEEIRKFNRTSYREDAVFIFLVRPGAEEEGIKRYIPEVPIYTLTDCFNQFEFHDYYFDHPVHCNKRACEGIAEYVLKYVETILHDTSVQGTKQIPPAIESQNHASEELTEYLGSLRKICHDGLNGAIVMNCNPFTNGHLYLIEQASKQVDNLYIFVVSEDKSYFSFEDRIRLVKEGIKNRLNNVIVVPSGKFILSADTFPEYFSKENAAQDISLDTSFDIELFSKYIAPVLNISVRFVGEEPKDVVTRQYNRDMQRILPQYGIKFVCMDRKEVEGGECISASDVRRLWKEGNREEVKKRVPESTYRYLFKEE